MPGGTGRGSITAVKRAGLFGALWLAATAATAAVAWGAVRLAGEQTGEQALRPLSVRQVEALAASTTTMDPASATSTAAATGGDSTTTSAAGASTTAASTTVTSAPAATAFARQTPGGTVVVGRAGEGLSLVSATPAAGYSVEVKSAGPGEVVVVFEGSGREIGVRAHLDDGEIVFTVETEAAEDD